MREVMILPEAGAIAREGAERFTALARLAIAATGRFTMALSGGSTPKALFALLVDQPIDWAHVHVFWGDERCVPPDHADSNYRMAHEALLSKVALPAQNVHRMRGEIDPAQAARAYEAELRHIFGSIEWPRFDLILLGLGTDAHTASLFPNTSAIHEATHWVVGHFVEKLQTHRLTLTPPVINHAKQIIFLVAGTDKAAALRSVFEGPRDVDQFPAQVIEPLTGRVTWLIDEAAAVTLGAP